MPNPNPHLALADAAEQRANAATPGPWWHDGENGCKNIYASEENALAMSFTCGLYNEAEDEANADFIAHARTDVPALAAAVREQAATIAALQAKLTQALDALNSLIDYVETDADEDSKDWREGQIARAAVERLKEAK